MEVRKYSTVQDIVNLYPIFTKSSLRHMINENKNGIHTCMKKLGGRVFFDLEKFQEWIDKQSY